jgi:hypothetical protein
VEQQNMGDARPRGKHSPEEITSLSSSSFAPELASAILASVATTGRGDIKSVNIILRRHDGAKIR